MRTTFHDKPCAALGLYSYRYRLPNNCFVMIGAIDLQDAVSQAIRSMEKGHKVNLDNLDIWNYTSGTYVPVTTTSKD